MRPGHEAEPPTGTVHVSPGPRPHLPSVSQLGRVAVRPFLFQSYLRWPLGTEHTELRRRRPARRPARGPRARGRGGFRPPCEPRGDRRRGDPRAPRPSVCSEVAVPPATRRPVWRGCALSVHRGDHSLQAPLGSRDQTPLSPGAPWGPRPAPLPCHRHARPHAAGPTSVRAPHRHDAGRGHGNAVCCVDKDTEVRNAGGGPLPIHTARCTVHATPCHCVTPSSHE